MHGNVQKRKKKHNFHPQDVTDTKGKITNGLYRVMVTFCRINAHLYLSWSDDIEGRYCRQ